MIKILQKLQHAFKSRPILTNAVVYGTLYFGAECSGQLMSQKEKPLDISSLKRYLVFGTAIQGPLLTVWYKWLDKHYVGTTYKIIAKKVLIDQFIMTPHLVWIFFLSMSIMEGKKDIFEECKIKFIPTFEKSCMFWLPTQTVNFLLIPPAYRVVYMGVCSFAWVNILCYIKRQSIK